MIKNNPKEKKNHFAQLQKAFESSYGDENRKTI